MALWVQDPVLSLQLLGSQGSILGLATSACRGQSLKQFFFKKVGGKIALAVVEAASLLVFCNLP